MEKPFRFEARKRHFVKEPSLSLCMVVKNEEFQLAACLRSVKEVVHEIVLLDTGSIDGTVRVAKHFGARVVLHEWKDDFSEARNRSLREASGDWILVLDADERLHREDILLVKKAIRGEGYEGVFFAIHNCSEAGRVSSTHYAIRLFRNREGVLFQGRIHEQIRLPGPAARSEIRVSHLGYDLDQESMRRKHLRNLGLLQKQREEEEENPATRFHLANVRLLLGDLAGAVAEARRAMDATKGEEKMLPLYLTAAKVLIDALLEAREFEAAEAVCLDCLELRPDFIDALFTLGRLYRLRGDYRRAILFLNEFLSQRSLLDRDPGGAFFYRCLKTVGKEGEARNDLGGIFFELGNYERAQKEVARALAVDPANEAARRNLEVMVKRKLRGDAPLLGAQGY